MSKSLNRRRFCELAGGTLVGGSISGQGATSPSPSSPIKASKSQKRPNILVMMTDQQRFDSLGCYGSEAAHTPNLDRLAGEGVLFETCYVSNPVCTPSRSSMLTGKTVPGHGVYRLYDNLPHDQLLFTKRLQESGYQTALFGKLHVNGRLFEANHRHPNDGFDIYEWCLEPSIHMDSPFNGYTKWLEKQDPAFHKRLQREGRLLQAIPRELHLTHWAAERTIDLIKNSEPDKPFFCLMSVFDPHNPYRGYPEEMAELIDESKIRDPIEGSEYESEPRSIQQEREQSYMGKFSEFSVEEIRKMKKDYHATVAFFDSEVGRVLDALEQKGIDGDTIVIFLSDGGDMLGDHRLLVKGAFFYDASVRVPFLLRWPGHVEGGTRVPALVHLQDLAPTVLAAAGLLTDEVKEEMPESSDLLDLAQGRVDRIHDSVVCCYRNTGISDEADYHDPEIHATMLREERYKLNVFLTEIGVEGQLFDMQEDPQERVNLWSSEAHQTTRLRLMEQLVQWETRQELMLGSRGGGQVPSASQKLDNRQKP